MDSIYKKVRILDVIHETPDSRTFRLAFSDGSTMKYVAGQFLTLVFPKPDGKEDRRSYSFSSTPGIDPDPAITVKWVANGEYSRKLIDYIKKGDEILTIGASGYFVIPEGIEKFEQIFFLAAGSGITPVFSLIKSLLSRPNGPEITLIYSNRSRDSTIFRRTLIELRAENPERFRIEFLNSDSSNLTRARLGKWLLENLLKEYRLGDPAKALFYLCGPFDYMRMAVIVLQTEGVPTDNIRKENFASVRPRFVYEPPDKDLHQVKVLIQGKEHSFSTQYPETILQKAKKLGIALPYSCESGQCGTCAATCLSGKTWMWNNEVLVDSEVAKGRTLTCTAYPIEGDVVIKFDR